MKKMVTKILLAGAALAALTGLAAAQVSVWQGRPQGYGQYDPYQAQQQQYQQQQQQQLPGSIQTNNWPDQAYHSNGRGGYYGSR